MKKLVSISTAVSAIQVQDKFSRSVQLVQRTVGLDNDGQGWELATHGSTVQWVKLPELPQEGVEPEVIN